MPQQTAIRNPVPLWLRPGQESVLDSPLVKAIRVLADLVGMNDPMAQVASLIGPLAAVRPGPGLKSDPGWLYHATNEENAASIAKEGLRPRRPWFGTDQPTWPDGTTKPRSYFSRIAGNVWQFAPEHGKPVILRVNETVPSGLGTELSDWYTSGRIAPEQIEILDDVKGWIPLSGFFGGGPK